jgi:hypothetical protein
MSLTHSPNTHRGLIARIPLQTGRKLAEWSDHLESGPASCAVANGLTGSPTNTVSATATRSPSSVKYRI